MAREINDVELKDYFEFKRIPGFGPGDRPEQDDQENGFNGLKMDLKAILDEMKYYKKNQTEPAYNALVNTLLKNGIEQFDVDGILENFDLPTLTQLRTKEENEQGENGNPDSDIDYTDPDIPYTPKDRSKTDDLLRDVQSLRNANSKDDMSLARLLELESPELYTQGFEVIQEKLSEDVISYDNADTILTEVESIHRFILANEFDEQMQTISEKIEELSKASLDKTGKEKRQRDALRKLAEKKIAILESKGIVETIEKGRRTEKKVIDDAKDVLLPDLEKARDIGSRTVDRLEDEKEDMDYMH